MKNHHDELLHAALFIGIFKESFHKESENGACTISLIYLKWHCIKGSVNENLRSAVKMLTYPLTTIYGSLCTILIT
jgi:hypothetical protein